MVCYTSCVSTAFVTMGMNCSLGLYCLIESQVMATTVLGNLNSETVYVGILSN